MVAMDSENIHNFAYQWSHHHVVIFHHGGGKWSSEQPIQFLFHTLEFWRPISLSCISDVIYENKGDQGRQVVEVVCRRLGYSGLKPVHEKAVRSFVNG